MGRRLTLLVLSAVTIGLFTIFSYTVAKEHWRQVDFDTTVKVQNHVPSRLDSFFSYFTILGSVEVTVLLAFFLAVFSIFRKKWLAFFGWLMIVPATIVEVLGKLILYHPAPPLFFLRTIVEAPLPSFEVNTNFSYPSGHITRTAFLVTTLLLLTFFSKKSDVFKLFWMSVLVGFALAMMFTRVYLGEHWISDVLGGALLGASFGAFAASLMVKNLTNVSSKA